MIRRHSLTKILLCARVPHVAAFRMYDDDFADGLLGRDFLDHFKVVMDPAAGIVTLVPPLGETDPETRRTT